MRCPLGNSVFRRGVGIWGLGENEVRFNHGIVDLVLVFLELELERLYCHGTVSPTRRCVLKVLRTVCLGW